MYCSLLSYDTWIVLNIKLIFHFTTCLIAVLYEILDFSLLGVKCHCWTFNKAELVFFACFVFVALIRNSMMLFFLWSFVSSVILYLYKNILLYNNGSSSVVTASAERQTTAGFFQVILLLLCHTKQFSWQTIIKMTYFVSNCVEIKLSVINGTSE